MNIILIVTKGRKTKCRITDPKVTKCRKTKGQKLQKVEKQLKHELFRYKV